MNQSGPEKEQNINIESIESLSVFISQKGLHAANKYLIDLPELKNYAIAHYSDMEEVLGDLEDMFQLRKWGEYTPDEKRVYLKELDDFFSDRNSFIETVDKSKEKSEVSIRVKNRLKINPVASEEELSAHVYKEELEFQVRDAVFTLRRKGYNTWESGFDGSRPQMMGIDNANITVPESIVEYFKNERNIDISIAKDIIENKVEIQLVPFNDLVMLSQWKLIWDEFADMMPDFVDNDEKDITKMSSIHTTFYKMQEEIREGKNVYLGYGIAYIDGKTREMDYQDFQNKYQI